MRFLRILLIALPAARLPAAHCPLHVDLSAPNLTANPQIPCPDACVSHVFVSHFVSSRSIFEEKLHYW